MHYRLAGATIKADTEITNMGGTTVEPVTEAGLTKVIAWVELKEGEKTYRSDYSYFNVKIDNKEPDAPTAKIVATQGNEITGDEASQTSTYWYKTNVELEITANDDNSGVYGYTYSITGTKSVSETALIGKTQKMTFETDGTYTLIIKAIDKAGNQSTPYTITIYKDSTPPNVFAPSISNITNTGFTISAYTMDDVSGIAKYEYFVNNDKKYEGTENTYTVSGLSKDTTYGVYVNAYDKAGNIQASSAISVYTAGSTAGGTTTPGGNTGPDGSTIGYGTYTLFYDSNGVTTASMPSSRTFAHGETFRITTDVPRSTQAGYNFLAWSTDVKAEEKLYYPGNEITGYGNITLYAIWTDKCTISYNANGGSVTPASQSFENGYSIVVPSDAGTYQANPSAKLIGWAYTADNNFVMYLPGGVYNDYAYGTCTLYAVWDLGVTLDIDYHGATYANTHDEVLPKKLTYASGLGVKLPTRAGTHPNTNITHWKWAIGNADGSSMGSYWEGTSGAYLSDTTVNGKTLHAMWDCQLSYNANGGNSTPSSQIVKYKENITVPSSAGTKSGYIFYGWAKTSTSKEIEYRGTCNPYLEFGGSQTVYAVWYSKSYSVGAYVAYTPPTSNPASYSTTQGGAERSGNGNQSIAKANIANWRVVRTNGDKLVLVADTIPSGNLTLNGANGYNNGVKLLNDAANTLYGNGSWAKGRNLTIEDVNSLTGVTPSTSLDSNYNKEFKPSNRYYPKIFAAEKTGAPNGTYGTSLGLSDQTSWYSGNAQGNTSFKGKYTYYSYNTTTYKATSTVQSALITGQTGNTGNTSHTAYWLASRCVKYNSPYFLFWLFFVSSGNVNANWTYASSNGTGNPSYAVRPVIEIDLNSAVVGKSGNGTSGSKLSITPLN